MSLTDQQKKFVRYFVESGKPTESARRAGYSIKNATKAAAHMIKESPNVMEAIDEARALKSKASNYDLEMAMREADDAYIVAKDDGNAPAMLTATKLKAQLMKILDDKPAQAQFQIMISGIGGGEEKTVVSVTQSLPSVNLLTGDGDEKI